MAKSFRVSALRPALIMGASLALVIQSLSIGYGLKAIAQGVNETTPGLSDVPSWTMPIPQQQGDAQTDAAFVPVSIVPAKRTIYVYNPDYPPTPISVYPQKPEDQTNFLKLLNDELSKNNYLEMTENVENADYRISIECAGATACTKLRVFIMTPKRDVLNGFTVEKIAGPFGWSRLPLHVVVDKISDDLQQRISKLEQGDYGYSHY
ncbi:MAG: hypothetical protein VKJ04_06890 [Vampirovibrionales bacterium]|nr:hypothetical protein [Vampirovibrionales bacterium]